MSSIVNEVKCLRTKQRFLSVSFPDCCDLLASNWRGWGWDWRTVWQPWWRWPLGNLTALLHWEQMQYRWRLSQCQDETCRTLTVTFCEKIPKLSLYDYKELLHFVQSWKLFFAYMSATFFHFGKRSVWDQILFLSSFLSVVSVRLLLENMVHPQKLHVFNTVWLSIFKKSIMFCD